MHAGLQNGGEGRWLDFVVELVVVTVAGVLRLAGVVVCRRGVFVRCASDIGCEVELR